MANEKPTSCTKSFKHESFRYFVILVIAICLIVCIVSQVSVCVYIYHKFSRLDKRMDDFGNVLESILDGSSSKFTSSQRALNENGGVVRERRSLQQTNTNLQGLVKRLNVMEKRYAENYTGEWVISIWHSSEYSESIAVRFEKKNGIDKNNRLYVIMIKLNEVFRQ